MKLALLFISLLSYAAFGQDSTFYKSAYAGSHMIVPENETWEVDRVFVNGGDAYSIQVANTNFNETYHAGDTIRAPYYIAEIELLSKKDMVQYQFYFKKK
jgi:hypothetical protein